MLHVEFVFTIKIIFIKPNDFLKNVYTEACQVSADFSHFSFQLIHLFNINLFHIKKLIEIIDYNLFLISITISKKILTHASCFILN